MPRHDRLQHLTLESAVLFTKLLRRLRQCTTKCNMLTFSSGVFTWSFVGGTQGSSVSRHVSIALSRALDRSCLAGRVPKGFPPKPDTLFGILSVRVNRLPSFTPNGASTFKDNCAIRIAEGAFQSRHAEHPYHVYRAHKATAKKPRRTSSQK